MSHGGKGSAPRPFSVSQKEYESRWDAIFSRDGLDDKQEEVLEAYNNERLVSKCDEINESVK